MPVIEVSHLTKEYRLGAMQGLKQTLLNTAARLTGKEVQERPLFKALDDVSFSIEPGEVVGIIGHNGAGKSTLLKMLAKISTPTSGSIKVNGRIAPLIEVGAGFVPDFTGRENVYLNAAILGMSRQEIDKKFDEIVDFAEMAEFIDTPVKRYSSGMQVKLAFAVATSIESEILIVDEVLAVGDLAFQRKCFDRMEDLIKRQGKTVLIVSHNIRQIERLCSRVLLLNHGKIVLDGQAGDACEAFYAQSDAKVKRTIDARKLAGPVIQTQTSGIVDVLEVALLDNSGCLTEKIRHGDDITVRVRYRANKELVNPSFGFGIHTTDFLYLATHNSEGDCGSVTIPRGVYEARCLIHKFPFLAGVYSVRLGINSGDISSAVYYAENLLNFQVEGEGPARSKWGAEGFVMLDANWETVAEQTRDAETLSAASEGLPNTR